MNASLDLLLAGMSAALWYFWPQLGYWPLLIALIPWVIRLARGLPPFQRTSLDPLVALFLVTAALATWTAYDTEAAQSKFWLVVGAIFLYYALAGQPQRNWWPVANLLALFGILIAAFFLLTHDWQTQPEKVTALNSIALDWMSLRPSLAMGQAVATAALHPNVAGGLMAMLAPFLAAAGLRARRQGRFGVIALALAGGGIWLIGLLFTGSRGAWLAVVAALSVWLLWSVTRAIASPIVTSRQAGRQRRAAAGPELVFGLVLMVLGTLGAIYLLGTPGGLLALADRLPGPANTGSRLELARGGLALAADFPLAGGGLGAFPGLYAQYIRGLPVFLAIHSHNFFLDVAIEQGIVGALALAGIIAGSVLLLRRRSYGHKVRHTSLLRWAIVASFVVVVTHGLVEDALYGSRATLLLLLLPGLAAAVTTGPDQRAELPFGRSPGTPPPISRSAPTVRPNVPNVSSPAYKPPTSPLPGAGHRAHSLHPSLVIASIVALLLFHRPLIAAGYANLGAVLMARVELADWPSGEWDDGQNVAALDSAERLFYQALAWNPANRTANHRLGLIAMLRHNFASAVVYLERARQADGTHYGVQKALGYSYVWSNQLEPALELLASIPEAPAEMGIYSWWWAVRDRDDLAAQAAAVEGRMRRRDVPPVGGG